jgi:hypothetical protein
MYFGPRRPSLSRRLAARGSLSRFIRHSLGVKAPRGLGLLTNPGRAIENRIRYRKDRAWASLGWDPGALRSGRPRSSGAQVGSSASGADAPGCGTGCAAGCVSIPLGILFIGGFPWLAIPLFVIAALVLGFARFLNGPGDAVNPALAKKDDLPIRSRVKGPSSSAASSATPGIDEVERISWRFTPVSRDRLPAPGLSAPGSQYTVTPLPNEMLLYLGRQPDGEFIEVIAPTGRYGTADDPGAPAYELWVFRTSQKRWTTSRQPPNAAAIVSIIADWMRVGWRSES